MALTAADRALLQRLLHQEAGAWKEFVERYLGLIYHVIRTSAHQRNQSLSAEDVEDLAADTLLQVLARDYAVLRRFKGNCSLPAYLTVIARRTCLHELQRRGPVRAAVKAAALPPDDEQASRAELHLDNTEEVERLLAKLPPRERQVVRMFYIEGKTYDEIGADLGIPRNTIGPILSRARGVLRQDSPSA